MPELILGVLWTPWWCCLHTSSDLGWPEPHLVFCLYLVFLSSHFFLCPSFIVISGAVICEVSQTSHPVCISQLQSVGSLRCMVYGVAYPGQQRGCDQLGKASDLWCRWSFAFMGNTWKESLVLFLPSATPPPTYTECSPPLLFFSFLAPSCMPCWSASGSRMGEKKP